MESLWVGEYSGAGKEKGNKNKFKTEKLMNGDEINRKESGVAIYGEYSNKQYLNIK